MLPEHTLLTRNCNKKPFSESENGFHIIYLNNYTLFLRQHHWAVQASLTHPLFLRCGININKPYIRAS